MSDSRPCLAEALAFPEISYHGPSRGVALGDRIADKLGDTLFLLDDILEMATCEYNSRIDDIARALLSALVKKSIT